MSRGWLLKQIQRGHLQSKYPHRAYVLVALPDRKRGIRSQEFVARDLEDVAGHVLGFELVAADGSVGRAQLARFPGKVALAEGEFDLVIEGVLGADMARWASG
jgi:hypothetical protein